MSCSVLLFPTDTGGSQSGQARGVRDTHLISMETPQRNSVLPVSLQEECVCTFVCARVCAYLDVCLG